ncbi:MAG: amidohydrolase, partial [Chloroflexi bacterium]|nr:amidohydrolase [Chloroflexota bacterium]
MPDVPIVDAHLHLWDLERLPWTIWPSMPGMDRSFGLAELRRDTQGLPIDGFVYVQAEVEPPFARLEARWIAGLAEAEPRIQAIVPWAPL